MLSCSLKILKVSEMVVVRRVIYMYAVEPITKILLLDFLLLQSSVCLGVDDVLPVTIGQMQL